MIIPPIALTYHISIGLSRPLWKFADLSKKVCGFVYGSLRILRILLWKFADPSMEVVSETVGIRAFAVPENKY